ncbi:MAG: restriction endonuclease, partial [Candidatus Aquicultor sp.]
MLKVDWEALTPDEFVLLTLRLVEAMGFYNAQRIDGTGDRGIDVEAYLPARIPGIVARSRKWIFQCKHTKIITKAIISKELANFEAGGIDTWLLVTTAKPSPEMRRWLGKLEENKPFHIQAWWMDDIERYIHEYIDSLRSHLPDQVLRKLSLDKDLEKSSLVSMQALTAGFRYHVDTQVDRFAKGKYIPKLYVRRALQEDVYAFLGPEQDIAREVQDICVSSIKEALRQLQEYLIIYDRDIEQLQGEIIEIAKDLAAKT